MLVNTFVGNHVGEYYLFGRYGEQISGNQHAIAGVFQTDENTYALSSLPLHIVPDDAKPEWLGAWIVADAAQVPAPSTLILLLSGLGVIVAREWKKNALS